jgi:hypothetical protein
MMICKLVRQRDVDRPDLTTRPVHLSLLKDIATLTGHEREVIRGIVDIMLAAKSCHFEVNRLLAPTVRQRRV